MVIFYGPEEAPEAKELGQKSPGLPTRVGPPGRAPYLVDSPETFLM